MPQPEVSVQAVEKRLEGSVLAEVVLDVADHLADPGVERLIREALVDPIEGVFAHSLSDRPSGEPPQWADRPNSSRPR